MTANLFQELQLEDGSFRLIIFGPRPPRKTIIPSHCIKKRQKDNELFAILPEHICTKITLLVHPENSFPEYDFAVY